MTEIERLEELHLALEGAVDQLVRSQRIAVAEHGMGSAPVDAPPVGAVLQASIDRALADVVNVRNTVRDQLMKAKAQKPGPRPGSGVTPLRIRKDP
jgi:hypothetical protein